MTDVLAQSLEIRLPEDLAHRSLALARDLDISESELIRRALIQYLDGLRPIARTSEAEDERAARIRAYLGKVLHRARSWADVQSLLRRQGMAYAPRGGGLILVATATGHVLCKASDVGPAYQQLVRRYGHFPGHPHVHIARKIAAQEAFLIDEADPALL